MQALRGLLFHSSLNINQVKNLSIKAAGKGWNAHSVVSTSEEVFVNDPPHAIEGLSTEENAAQLKAVYAKCQEAVTAEKAKAATPVVEAMKAPEDTAVEKKGTQKK